MEPDIKPATMKLLDLSTGHITKKDNDLLTSYADRWKMNDVNGPRRVVDSDGPRPPLTVHSYDYGYFIPVPDADHWKNDGLRQFVDDGASVALSCLINLCIGEGFAVLRLDRDGTEVDELPRFEW